MEQTRACRVAMNNGGSDYIIDCAYIVGSGKARHSSRKMVQWLSKVLPFENEALRTLIATLLVD